MDRTTTRNGKPEKVILLGVISSSDITKTVDVKQVNSLITNGETTRSFPVFVADRAHLLQTNGEISEHQTWVMRIAAGELMIDLRLNQVTLRGFAVDHTALDEHLREAL